MFRAEYLGFNNRTCTSSLAPSKTAGPVMRGPSSSMMWREWLIRVQNKDEDRVDVTLQAFMHPALEDQGKCLGYVSNYYGNPEYRGSCVIPPYGNGLFINGTEDTGNDVPINPQVLSITTAPSGSAAEGAFELTAANKPDVCMRALAVEDCDSQAVLVEDPAEHFVESKKYKTWILTKRYDVVPKTSPPPPLSPPPPSPPPPASPPPPTPVPGPRIEPYQYGQTVVTWGYIEISVKSFGGNAACSVESITFTAVNKATAASVSTAAYSVDNLQRLPLATVPLAAWNEYEVYAVGTCSSGESTARSDALSVYSQVSNGVSSPPPPSQPSWLPVCTAAVTSPTTDWILTCGTTDCISTCNVAGKSCVLSGIQNVDSAAKARFVLNLFGNYIILSEDGIVFPDGLGLFYSPQTNSTLYWNGAGATQCIGGAVPNAMRMCCCGGSCPVQ